MRHNLPSWMCVTARPNNGHITKQKAIIRPLTEILTHRILVASTQKKQLVCWTNCQCTILNQPMIPNRKQLWSVNFKHLTSWQVCTNRCSPFTICGDADPLSCVNAEACLTRDVTRLGLGGPKPKPPKDVAGPSNWNGNRSFLHGCFGHHAAVG